MAWPCFLIEPTNRYQRYTRRYSKDGRATPVCPYGSYHNAVEILSVETIEGEHPVTYCGGTIPEDQLKAARWPAQCLCGYYFVEEDERQLGHHNLFRDARGNEYTLRNVPVGTMWHAWWAREFAHMNHANDPKGPLHVMLPGGFEWNIDGPSKNGGYWERQGTPPHVTVTPSILVPGYHGFLRDGVLTDPC